MTIDEYKAAVIELFRGDKASEAQWGAMAAAVLEVSEGANAETVDPIDETIGGAYEVCPGCQVHFRPRIGCPGCDKVTP